MGDASPAEKLKAVYARLLERYGPQRWWPGETPFEVMTGAVLTQSAVWGNVEKAIGNLKAAGKLSAAALRDIPVADLAVLIYPSGYYNAKSRKLKALAGWLGNYGDDLSRLDRRDTEDLRRELLGVHGIGPETADSILLYALGRPAFVIDAYTRRLYPRLGIKPDMDTYVHWQRLFTDNLQHEAAAFNEHHALIVRHGKESCRKTPRCRGCCLSLMCPAFSP